MQHLAEDPTNSNAVLGEEDLHLPISEDNREPPSIGGLPSRQVCSRQDHWCEQVDLALQARAHPQRWQTGWVLQCLPREGTILLQGHHLQRL